MRLGVWVIETSTSLCITFLPTYVLHSTCEGSAQCVGVRVIETSKNNLLGLIMFLPAYLLAYLYAYVKENKKLMR